MPTPAFSVQTDINVTPDVAFEYVSDLTKHGEWSANHLEVVATSGEPICAGKQYSSSADVSGLHFDAQLTVTQFDTPHAFAFAGHDKTGKFEHVFTFTASGSGTTVKRQLSFDLTPMQYMMYLLMYFPVRLPASRKAMDNLKAKLETT